MKCCFDGEMVDVATWHPDSGDRGFRYGDGLFETMTAFAERPRLFERHLKRLYSGMKVLGLDGAGLPTAKELIELIGQLRTKNAVTHRARVKLSCWRKTGGLYAPETGAFHWLLEVMPGTDPVLLVEQAGVARDCWVSYSPLSEFKRLSSDEYVLAGLECRRQGWDDIVICDRKGHLAEVLHANLFWFDGKEWFTPATRTGCIRGVMRDFVYDYMKARGEVVTKGRFDAEVLQDAELVISTNSSGIRYYQQIEGKTYTTHHPMVEELLRVIEEEGRRLESALN